MDGSGSHYVDYYVVFRRSKMKHWLFRWLDPYFQHCYAVKESPGKEFWMVVDANTSFTDIKLLSKIDYPHIRAIEPMGVVLSVRAKIDPDKNINVLNVFNCVEQVKALLGIRAFWVWTPYQLYKRLTNG